MDNNEIEQLMNLSSERFYEHIEERYGKFVGKILRYHDIDSYTVLCKVDKHELIDFFEKPDDENSTFELINLKKEICNIFHDSVSLKIGTKNKLILLMKSTQDIIKKKKIQLASQARLNRLDKYQSTSPSTNSSASDTETNLERYHASIEASIERILTKLKKNIHGITYTNVTVKDFKIIIVPTSDFTTPVCSIQCVCGHQTKLYLKHHRFQLSNFTKHLKNINNELSPLINNKNQELDDPEVLAQMDSDDQLLRSASNRSTVENKSSKYMYVDTDNTDNSTPVTTKKAYSHSQRSRMESDNNEYSGSSAKTTTNRHDRQPPTGILLKEGETQSSISIIPSSKSKKFVNIQQRQTTNPPPNYQHLKSLKEQSLNGNNSSQSKKRKFDENEKQTEFNSSTKNNKKISEYNIPCSNTNSSDILCELLNTIELNRHRSPNNYRYSNPVLRFAACLFILAGIYVYEYIRINFKFLLPSIQTIKNYYNHTPYSEAEFRFDESKLYLDSVQCQFVFLSEDCSAIIPRVEYDSTLNSFNGFVTPIVNGKPVENAFNCQSFEELEHLLESKPRANLVNVHLVQPLADPNSYVAPSATVLSAYGTDNKITSIDILKRWLMIYQELHSRSIRVLGFATDGDPKYLRAMRLASNFFVKTHTLNIYNDKLSFSIKIPSSWSTWYFLNPSQLFLFMQDGIHLCNKIRNRLLSQNAKLKMGTYKVSVKHLYQLIKTTNKIDHNLSISDLNIRDKQNFSSCQRIADDKILNLLLLNDEYNATYNYLLVLNLLIIAYTRPNVCLLTRIYYAWIVLFFIRLWRIWLHKTKRIRRFSTKNKKQNEQNYFITSNALLSIELNAHFLVYVYLLIEQDLVPESTANSIHLFSSQPCENLFRDTRALSGVYSTRINFTIKQFLQRINKLNALTKLRQSELNNKHEKIVFPVHHKIKRHTTETDSNNIDENADFNSDHVETIIFRAYEAAQQMVLSVGMGKDLIEYNLYNIEESSQMAQELLKLNSLTESEILILDGRNCTDSDEEVDFDEGDEEEDNHTEDANLTEDGDDEESLTEGDDEEDGFEHNSIDENSFEDDHAEDGDIEDCIDEDAVEEFNENVNDYYSSEDDPQPTSTFGNVQTTTYSGLRLIQSVSRTNVHKYFSINIHNKNMFLHKATATWYLQDRQTRLSCDRLQRVQLKEV